jgi:protein TonB
MFESTAYCDSFAGRRVWSTCLGFTGQVFLIAGAALIPLLSPDALERPQRLITALLPSMPVGRQEAPKVTPSHATAAVHTAAKPWQITEPTRIPPKALVIEDAPPAFSDSPVGALPGNATRGGAGLAESMLHDLVQVLPVVPAPVKPVTAAAAAPAVIPQVRVGGKVKIARAISQPAPRYPELAKIGHVSGVVELLAVIGIDGRIRELKITTGNPLLAGAALQAVRTWIYEPTMLNGEPVEVIAPITVTFRLN